MHPRRDSSNNHAGLALVGLGALLGAVACAAPQQHTEDYPPADVSAEQLAAAFADAPPATPESQIAHGAALFDDQCDVCHGTRGEGGSGIHRAAPQVAGPGVLATGGGERELADAAALFDYISREMPAINPGSLTEQEYWDLTAYLAYANDVSLLETIDADNAAEVSLAPAQDVAALRGSTRRRRAPVRAHLDGL
jgi:cytochrome c